MQHSDKAVPDLGVFLFECEKRSPIQCVADAMGGWMQLLGCFLWFPLGAIVPTSFMVAGVQWAIGDDDFIKSHITLIIALWIGIAFSLDVALFVALRNDYLNFRSASLAAYERGVRVRNRAGEWLKTYDQISALYFGAKKQSDSIRQRLAKRWFGTTTLDHGRMHIEFTDGASVQLPYCVGLFGKESIEKLTIQIARKRPGLFTDTVNEAT